VCFPDTRLYQVTRSGSAGICRYSQTWTGDNRTGWDSLRCNIATMLCSSLSGLPLTGSDIGGFAGPAPEEELFLRWVWCGVLLPRFSIHSANSDNTVTEPWMYPERMDIIRAAFRLRRRLIPLMYSLNDLSSRTGAPLLRPMVYEFPRDDHSRLESVDFMLGSGLLCGCVVEPGADSRRIRLPEGEAESRLLTPPYADFDVNGHVNNTKYMDWCCNALGHEAMASRQVAAFTVSYEGEILPGTDVRTELVRSGDQFAYCGFAGERRCFAVGGTLAPREAQTCTKWERKA